MLDQPEVQNFHDFPAQGWIGRAGVRFVKLVKLIFDQSMFLPVPSEFGIVAAFQKLFLLLEVGIRSVEQNLEQGANGLFITANLLGIVDVVDQARDHDMVGIETRMADAEVTSPNDQAHQPLSDLLQHHALARCCSECCMRSSAGGRCAHLFIAGENMADNPVAQLFPEQVPGVKSRIGGRPRHSLAEFVEETVVLAFVLPITRIFFLSHELLFKGEMSGHAGMDLAQQILDPIPILCLGKLLIKFADPLEQGLMLEIEGGNADPVLLAPPQ
jgi:hypothetical protein